ncbi:hypothetical protein BS47DRAFT_1253791, partial [Hydnum rufescens UP504]
YCAIDWIVELDNLYTKKTHSGKGPNHMIKHIIDQSMLINIYHNFSEVIEDNYNLTQRTVHHTSPSM